MSKPLSNSVTPQNKTSQSTAPTLPPCSIPYRKKLYVGYGLSFYCDSVQPPAVWEAHRHPDAQVLILGEGGDCTVHWMQKGRWHTRDVKGAHVWILAPRVAHRMEWRAHGLRAAIYLAPRFAQETAGRSIRGSQILDLRTVTSRDVRIRQQMRRFAKRSEPKTPSEILRMKSAGTILTTLLLQALDHAEAVPKSDPPIMADHVFERIDRMIDQRIEEKMLIPDLAKEAHMSRSSFHRRFRRRMGISPGAYLISRRIIRATELLDSTDNTICEVAMSVGFNSQSYFDRCFKKLMGRTPTQYRAEKLSG